MKAKGKMIRFPLIHHENHDNFDPVESRLEHLNNILANYPCDDDAYLHYVQQKIAEALYWYGEYLIALNNSKEE
tara:strand:+ start:1072 stop:1293 length:222 start_codon:yes stop_codon:yes gene_type:complete